MRLERAPSLNKELDLIWHRGVGVRLSVWKSSIQLCGLFVCVRLGPELPVGPLKAAGGLHEPPIGWQLKTKQLSVRCVVGPEQAVSTSTPMNFKQLHLWAPVYTGSAPVNMSTVNTFNISTHSQDGDTPHSFFYGAPFGEQLRLLGLTGGFTMVGIKMATFHFFPSPYSFTHLITCAQTTLFSANYHLTARVGGGLSLSQCWTPGSDPGRVSRGSTGSPVSIMHTVLHFLFYFEV